MAVPFQRLASPGGGLLARLAGRRRRASVIREIEDLLARAERVSDVTAERVAEVTAHHGTELGGRFRTPRRALYRRFLEHCLMDQALSSDESEDLAHLRTILELPAEDAAALHEEVGHAIYGAAIDRVLADQKLDPDEEAFLRRMRDDLQLPEGVAERLLSEGTERARLRFISRAVTREGLLLAPREAVLQLEGTSSSNIEDAVHAALEEAMRAVPKLQWIEIAQIRAEVGDGGVARWLVKLNAGVGSGA